MAGQPMKGEGEPWSSSPLGRLTLNRPERLNALGATALRELAQAARWFDDRPEVRVVVVSGDGRAFSAGADLRDPPITAVAPDSDNTWAVRREVGQYGLRMTDAIEQMRAITVAQVHGYAVGGGLVLMAACDLRVAAAPHLDRPHQRGAHATLGQDAFLRFGKGRPAAGLNFGDCFACALAVSRNEPLLFKGDDFGKTDAPVP
jgi:uncharacterized protein with PIN domain